MPITIGGSNVNESTTVTIPAHAAGDLIILYAYDIRTGVVPPAKPSAGGTVPTWTTIHGNGLTFGSSFNWIAVYAVATTSSHTSGTWVGTDVLRAIVLSGAKETGMIGATAFSTSFSTIAPGLTLSKTDGTSAILHQAFSNATTWGAVPTGYTDRGSSNQNRLLTKNVTTTCPEVDMNVDGFTQTNSIEILAAPVASSGFFTMFN